MIKNSFQKKVPNWKGSRANSVVSTHFLFCRPRRNRWAAAAALADPLPVAVSSAKSGLWLGHV